MDMNRALDMLLDKGELVSALSLVPSALLGTVGNDPTPLIKGEQTNPTTPTDMANYLKVVANYEWPKYSIDIYPGKYSK